jgi:hypothetical protein
LYVVKPTTTSAPGQEHHAGAERGVTICDDGGTVTTLADEDPRLIFVDRSTD